MIMVNDNDIEMPGHLGIVFDDIEMQGHQGIVFLIIIIGFFFLFFLSICRCCPYQFWDLRCYTLLHWLLGVFFVFVSLFCR